MSRNVLILNDGSQYENWGIQACIDGLHAFVNLKVEEENIARLDHSFMHKKYQYEPKIFGKKLFQEQSRIMRWFGTDFHLLPRVADEFEYVASKWLEGKGGKGAEEFLQKAKKADIIIFNAEGSTYRDNIGAIKGLFMLWFSKTKLGKRTAFMNGSVTLTLVDAILPAMVRKTFREIDVVAVREPYSRTSVVERYPELMGKVQVIPDSVFILDPPARMSERVAALEFINKDFFVVSRSMLPMDHARMGEHSALVQLITLLKERVPHCVLIAKDAEDQVLQDVAQLTGSFFIGSEFSYQDIMSILERASFLVSGRYHHLIFAAKVGCPVIPMATSSHKIHGLAALFPNLMPYPIDATDLLEETAQAKLLADQIMSGGQEMRDAYRERSLELQQDIRNHASVLDILLNQ